MVRSPANGQGSRVTGWRQQLRSVQAAALAGIVAAIGWVVALQGILDIPGPDASDGEIVAHYRGLAGNSSVLVYLQVLVVATVGFLWFIGVIRNRMGAGEPKLFGTVFLGGGILLAGLLFVGAAVAATPALLAAESDRAVDPDMAAGMRVQARIMLGVFAPRIASLFVFSMSTLALRTGAMPRWLVTLSYVTGVAMFVNVMYTEPNIYVFPVWMAAVSLYLLVAGKSIEEDTADR